MKTLSPFFYLLALVLALFSCQKETFEVNSSIYADQEYQTISQYLDLPEQPMEYTVYFPNYYLRRQLPIDQHKATVGRVLFYDKNLSEDKSISCASCHKQEIAFSDDVAFSEGIQGRRTARNSLALGSVFNFAEYYGSQSSGRIPFFWDNRASSVAEQSKETFANEREMGMSMHDVVNQVVDLPYYAPLFRAAYGTRLPIGEDQVLECIAEFINGMANVNSRFDQALDHTMASKNSSVGQALQEGFIGFSSQENIGKKLYMKNCSSCHGSITSPPAKIAENNGLSMDYQDDQGVGAYSGKESEKALFKVPTLRGIALSAPYMHDGSIATLDAVIDHYSTSIQDHPNLSFLLKDPNTGKAKKFLFDTDEKAALIAFLHTLTDEKIQKDERFADPFK